MDSSFKALLAPLDNVCDQFAEVRDGVLKAVRIADDDPEMALTRARKVLEYVIRDVFERRCNKPAGTQSLENLLQRLAKDGHIPGRVDAYANLIRKLGNVGTHNFGESLLDILESNGNKPFPIPLVISWGKSICDLLTAMHGLTPPLIRRDCKPGNLILLADQKSIRHVDFGCARDLGRTARERAAGKARLYTEGYAPPEQIVGKPEIRSDLFALAATLYHLATGKAPEGWYTGKELEQQLADPAGPIAAEHRWLFELIRINLCEDVNDQYFSGKEIKADLEAQRVTTELPCPKCRAMNKVRTPHCAKCAEPLPAPTLHCFMCDKFNLMGERFCRYCGNRLR